MVESVGEIEVDKMSFLINTLDLKNLAILVRLEQAESITRIM